MKAIVSVAGGVARRGRTDIAEGGAQVRNMLLRRFFGPKKVTVLVALPEEAMHVDDVSSYVIPGYPHTVLWKWIKRGEPMVPARVVNDDEELAAYAEEEYGEGNYRIYEVDI